MQQNQKTAIIGGSGLAQYNNLNISKRRIIQTPYGEPSSPVILGEISGNPIVFIARHGHGHTIAPHKVNYRANIWALAELGVKNIIAVGAVGAINPEYDAGDIVIPYQLIDYTYGRESTYFDDNTMQGVKHIDFTNPFSTNLRDTIICAANKNNIAIITQATNAVTQGPRLETAAEVKRLEQDGADVIGMTCMPEAALARELDIEYALINLVVNPAAGKNGNHGQIDIKEIRDNLNNHMQKVIDLIDASVAKIN